MVISFSLSNVKCHETTSVDIETLLNTENRGDRSVCRGNIHYIHLNRTED